MNILDLGVPVAGICIHEDEVGLEQIVPAIITKHFNRCIVEIHPSAVQSSDKNAIPRSEKESPVFLFTLPQCIFSLFAFGDIGDHRQECRLTPVIDCHGIDYAVPDSAVPELDIKLAERRRGILRYGLSC